MEPELYFYSTDGHDAFGPVTEDALRRLVRDKVLSAASFLCRQGETEWKPIDLPALLRPSTALRLPAYDPPPYVPTVKAKARVEEQVEQIEAVWDEGPYPQILKWGCGVGGIGAAVILTILHPGDYISASFLAALVFTALLPFLISRPFPRAWRLRVLAVGILVLSSLTIVGQIRHRKMQRLETSIRNMEATTRENARREIAQKGYYSGDVSQEKADLQKIADQTRQDDSGEARMTQAAVGVTQALLQKIEAANAAEKACGSFDPSQLGSLVDLNNLKESIGMLRTTQQGVVTFLSNYDDHCRAALASGGFEGAAVDQFIAGAHKSGQVDAALGIWKIKIKLSDDHVARLDFLDKHWGSWSARDGKIYFSTQADLDAYNALTRALVDDLQQGRDLQKMTFK
jgi:hypothetical protein